MTATSTAKLIDHSLSAARQIVQECAQIIDDGPFSPSSSPRHDASQRKRAPPKVDSMAKSRPCGLEGCEEPLIELLSRQASRILQLYESSVAETGFRDSNDDGNIVSGVEREKAISLVKRRLDVVTKTAYGKFYAYLYKEVPTCWRQLYTDAAILKFALLVLLDFDHVTEAGEEEEEEEEEEERRLKRERIVDQMVKTLDLSLILAGAAGESRGRRWVDGAFGLLEDVLWDINSAATVPAAGGEKKDDDEHGGERPQKKQRLSPSLETKDQGNEQVSDNWQNTPSFSTHEPFTPPVKNPIRRVSADSFSIEEFQSHFSLPRADGGPGPAPLIITGLADHWPAVTTHPWNKPAYLMSRTLSGRRLVPVEIGRSYVDEGWGQKIISFGEFLSKYIDSSIPFTPSSSDVSPFLSSSSAVHPEPASSDQLLEEKKKQIAYLAQHPLFLQLPRLRSDILIPDLCYTAPPLHPTDPSQDQPEVDSPQLNAWFGPPGTITPLHTDPYHNLLVQVVGRKYVRLYGPEKTRKMRPRGKEGGVEMGNTSGWDLGVEEGWDAAEEERKETGEGKKEDKVEEREKEEVNSERGREEDFKKVPFVDCILEPGDTLYIPIGWWHYVRGLSVSFSVSFWWN
ncbi:Clavaminate synthase-like protein [Sordaria brevicollis]|uniref:Clavaminate synthase-like protein n=1 Tax=Sordaria brevicollis TaxID=83679 RepID=A0AAE0PER0_SORBR|nr:Clavaminate synthase-like protein [Sordaria brevicollis]